MLNQMNADVETVAKAIGSALEGLQNITFALDVHLRRTTHGKVDTYITVTLYFCHAFSKQVKGGDDIEWLAGECRRTAEEQLKKLCEIAKANEFTK